ncbi:hypothetical protein EXIGLDRAFT_699535 [Exidia glandulosa HHB12029]|uniref:Uncharacterized protein n=1 Tax=Exidia glandulosa HHB12029 TaxID=1314781 RepID=A0A165DUV8_EXIGL|nr:hypothetical protein EXIGLDRAFT_699535 [Exidia glandulosa HHB12029]
MAGWMTLFVLLSLAPMPPALGELIVDVLSYLCTTLDGISEQGTSSLVAFSLVNKHVRRTSLPVLFRSVSVEGRTLRESTDALLALKETEPVLRYVRRAWNPRLETQLRLLETGDWAAMSEESFRIVTELSILGGIHLEVDLVRLAKFNSLVTLRLPYLSTLMLRYQPPQCGYMGSRAEIKEARKRDTERAEEARRQAKRIVRSVFPHLRTLHIDGDVVYDFSLLRGNDLSELDGLAGTRAPRRHSLWQ